MVIKRRKTIPLIASNILWIVAGTVLAAGIFLGWRQYIQNKATDKKVSGVVRAANEGRSTVVPSTKKPTTDEFSQYQVADGMTEVLSQGSRERCLSMDMFLEEMYLEYFMT
jgi:acylphosphatase